MKGEFTGRNHFISWKTRGSTMFNCSFNKSSDVEFASETSQHHLADLAIGFTATASDSVASKESRQKNAGAKRAEYVGCVPMLSMY